MRWFHLFWLGVAAATMIAPASRASDLDLSGARVYSDVCAHPTEGDLLGEEVIMRGSRQTPQVFFRLAEGEFRPPILTQSRIVGRRVRFTFTDQVPMAFRGEIHGRWLIGELRSPQERRRLRLRLHPDVGYADCR
jgi:hypothetical protein